MVFVQTNAHLDFSLLQMEVAINALVIVSLVKIQPHFVHNVKEVLLLLMELVFNHVQLILIWAMEIVSNVLMVAINVLVTQIIVVPVLVDFSFLEVFV